MFSCAISIMKMPYNESVSLARSEARLLDAGLGCKPRRENDPFSLLAFPQNGVDMRIVDHVPSLIILNPPFFFCAPGI